MLYECPVCLCYLSGDMQKRQPDFKEGGVGGNQVLMWEGGLVGGGG